MNRMADVSSYHTNYGRLAAGLAIVFAATTFSAAPSAAAPLSGAGTIPATVEEVSAAKPTPVARRAAVRRGAVAAGPRGAVAVRKTTVVTRPVRPLARRAYYGKIVGGVALGTLIAATAVPVAPAPGLCWFWADPARTQGYWDYCKPR